MLTGHLYEHSRNHIMGHIQGGTLANYKSITDDAQSIFKETPSRMSLLSLATHASITPGLSALQQATAARKATIQLDVQLTEWKKRMLETAHGYGNGAWLISGYVQAW
jgi:hypothetical protein